MRDCYLFPANDIRDDYTFLHTFDAGARDHFKVNVNSVVVLQAERFYTKYESKRSVYEVKVRIFLSLYWLRVVSSSIPQLSPLFSLYSRLSI